MYFMSHTHIHLHLDFQNWIFEKMKSYIFKCTSALVKKIVAPLSTLLFFEEKSRVPTRVPHKFKEEIL
jgi:hypothetical protein